MSKLYPSCVNIFFYFVCLCFWCLFIFLVFVYDCGVIWISWFLLCWQLLVYENYVCRQDKCNLGPKLKANFSGDCFCVAHGCIILDLHQMRSGDKTNDSFSSHTKLKLQKKRNIKMLAGNKAWGWWVILL